MSSTKDIEEFIENESGNKIGQEDINSCLLPFFLEDIMRKGMKNDQNKNIIKITSKSGQQLLDFQDIQIQKELPAYMNLFSRRRPDSLLCEETFFTDQRENMLLFNMSVPYIKLYKIFETDNGGNKTYSQVHIPFEVISRGLGERFEESIITKILQGGGDGAVGIANFDWISDGRNEANKTQYTVNFKIIMQSIKELDKIRNKIETNSVSILSLLYPTTEKTQNFDSSNQLIKAEIGYSLPIEYQQKYGEYFKTTLNLFLHKHNFTFHENGKVELDITYIANIDNEFGNPVKWNILTATEARELQNDLNIIQSLPKTGNEYRYSDKYYDKPNNLGVRTGVQGVSQYFRFPIGLSKRGKKIWYRNASPYSTTNYVLSVHANNAIKEFKEELKKIKLSTFIQLLNNLIQKSKLNSFVLDAQETLSFKSILSINNYNGTTLKFVKEQIGNLLEGNNNNIAKPKNSGQINIQTIQKKVGGVFGLFATTKNVIDQESLAKQLQDLNTEGDVSSRMDYVYLGDLLQEILELTLSPTDLQKFNIFLSPFGYIDYKSISAAQIGNDEMFSTVKLPDGSNRRVINAKGLKRRTNSMAYIPITIPSLVRWWNREIIEKNETHYSLFSLIRSVITTLIPESISVRNVVNAPTQYFGTLNFNFNTKDKGIIKNEKISISDLSSLFATRAGSFENGVVNNNIVFISSREDPNLPEVYKGDFRLDCKKNIFHAEINNSNSIIIKASFKRDDNAKLETANLLAAADQGSNEIIRQVYHCTLEMIGNNFFEPGCLIYIRPTFPGTNLQNNLLHNIGLGGYYRIIKIDNKISTGNYMTTLHCRWEMWGPK